MPPERIDADPQYAEQPDLAIVALSTMLARYPHTHCEHMSDSILSYLRYIAFDQLYARAIGEAAARIFQEWQFRQAEAPAIAGTGLLTIN